MNKAILHHYRRFRRHQIETYGLDGQHRWDDKQGKYVSARQFTGGGAAYGEHAYAAYNSARRHIHFMEDMKKYA